MELLYVVHMRKIEKAGNTLVKMKSYAVRHIYNYNIKNTKNLEIV